MPSITPTISPMRVALEWISPMRETTSCMVCAPRAATELDCATSSRALCVFSALLRTEPASCCIELAVCCKALAWLSVREDKSVLPEAISADAVFTPSAVSRTSSTMLRSFLRMPFSSARSQEISSLPGDSILVSRSPPAMRTTAWTVDSTESLMLERISHPASSATTQPAAEAVPIAQATCPLGKAHTAAAPSDATQAAISEKPITTRRTRLILRIHSMFVPHHGFATAD